MLTKERQPTGHFAPSLSQEAWGALKLASIAGTSDRDLSEVYEVSEEAIRKKRSRDKAWAIAVGVKNRLMGKSGLKSKHLEAIKPVTPVTERHKMAENQSIQVIGATFADESQATRHLALQIAQKGLKSALQSDGSLKPLLEVQEPAHVKVYADIAKIAGQWGGDNQITVNCQAYAGASVARESTDGETSIIDIE